MLVMAGAILFVFSFIISNRLNKRFFRGLDDSQKIAVIEFTQRHSSFRLSMIIGPVVVYTFLLFLFPAFTASHSFLMFLLYAFPILLYNFIITRRFRDLGLSHTLNNQFSRTGIYYIGMLVFIGSIFLTITIGAQPGNPADATASRPHR